MLLSLCLLALSASDAPVNESPAPLLEARRLADALRYEEALLEYRRYLSLPSRPARERAEALFECGFLYFVLGDEASGYSHAHEALDAWPALGLSSSAPTKQRDFFDEAQRRHALRVVLAEAPRTATDEPETVRVRLQDTERRVKRVLLRHGLSPSGPYYSVPMACTVTDCQAQIPSAPADGDHTAYYFVEALGEKGQTLALDPSPFQPRKLAVVRPRPWHSQPWAWAALGTAVIAAGAVVYLLAPPPPLPTR